MNHSTAFCGWLTKCLMSEGFEEKAMKRNPRIRIPPWSPYPQSKKVPDPEKQMNGRIGYLASLDRHDKISLDELTGIAEGTWDISRGKALRLADRAKRSRRD